MNNELFSVSGLVVHTNPARLAEVRDNLNTMPGVEVHAAAPEGKLVVTVEELISKNAGQKTMVDTITQISHVGGVISTALVYTHNDTWSET